MDTITALQNLLWPEYFEPQFTEPAEDSQQQQVSASDRQAEGLQGGWPPHFEYAEYHSQDLQTATIDNLNVYPQVQPRSRYSDSFLQVPQIWTESAYSAAPDVTQASSVYDAADIPVVTVQSSLPLFAPQPLRPEQFPRSWVYRGSHSQPQTSPHALRRGEPYRPHINCTPSVEQSDIPTGVGAHPTTRETAIDSLRQQCRDFSIRVTPAEPQEVHERTVMANDTTMNYSPTVKRTYVEAAAPCSNCVARGTHCMIVLSHKKLLEDHYRVRKRGIPRRAKACKECWRLHRKCDCNETYLEWMSASCPRWRSATVDVQRRISSTALAACKD